MENRNSRHPSMQYWGLTLENVQTKSYRQIIDDIAENGCFNTLNMSSWEINFWDFSWEPTIREIVSYANSRDIRVTLQMFPKGFKVRSGVDVENAVALVTEYEETVQEDQLVIRTEGKHVRHPHVCSSLKSELLKAVAFRKSGNGFYEESSFLDITNRAKILYEDPECLTLGFDTADLQDYTVYVMVAHYYGAIDLFSDQAIQEFRDLIDAYADTGLDGIVLDEYKNMTIMPPWQIDEFRERFYGKNFHRYFREQTGNDLVQTMFEMRFCPENREDIRIRAINQYFDIFRHSTKRVETFVAEYSVKVVGPQALSGLHNTYHNTLQSDEIWQTCCNWWEVPRKYAQTDECIAYPIRMGMACGCPENLVYDMYYTTNPEGYFKKAMKDAPYGCRVTYHIIRNGDSDISLNTGDPKFLEAVKPYEDKIRLLNLFDPKLPKMELLVVFGFPALCNWYPDYDARNQMDINGKLNIEDRVEELWNGGYFNALAPSDAIADGRITMKDGKFDYCGHRFEKLLYLYPQYSKASVLSFLQNAIDQGYDVKILGELTRDFDGNPATLVFGENTVLTEESDISQGFGLTPNPIPNGCQLEDGSVVITDYDSIAEDKFCTYRFDVNGFSCEATFKGVLAVKLNDGGEIEKIAAGNLKEVTRNEHALLSLSGDEDYVKL